MTVPTQPTLELTITEAIGRNGELYQCLEIDILGKLNPSILTNLQLPEINRAQGIVIWGSAPIWLYCHLVQRCASSPWIGCYNAALGGFVVIASRSPEMAVGDVFQLASKPQCPAILIGGPPQSGKSVLSHAMLSTLHQVAPDRQIYLHRAQWDGEGNWYLETDSRSHAESLRQRSKAHASDRFFQFHANLVSNLRETQDLVFVDFGGLPKFKDPNLKDIVLLHHCTHFIIISRDPDLIAEWQEFCHRRGGLQPLAIIHSKLEPCLRILQTDPYLELEAGPWNDTTQTVPSELLQPVLALLSSIH